MTWERIASLIGGIILANLFFAFEARWKAKKTARTEIPAYKNWRGEYVPDLHLIRAKRFFIAAAVVAFVGIMVLGYLIVTNYQPSGQAG